MAKPKPDQIIRHEYVLGKVERQLVEQASAAYSINRVLTPVVNLLNDVTGMATVLSLAAIALGFHYTPYTPAGVLQDTASMIADFRQQLADAKVDLEEQVDYWTDPGTYTPGIQSIIEQVLINPIIGSGIPGINPVTVGIWNRLDLMPNANEAWFGLDLNPFN